MKTLTKLALAAVILTTAFAAQAGGVRGYTRSNGTYVAPHYRSDSGSLGGGSSSSSVYPLKWLYTKLAARFVGD